MTAEDFAVAYAIAGLSHRISELHDLDQCEYVPRHSKPAPTYR
jgi:hypothetical protein